MSTRGLAQRRAVRAHRVDDVLVEREAGLDDRREVGARDRGQPTSGSAARSARSYAPLATVAGVASRPMRPVAASPRPPARRRAGRRRSRRRPASSACSRSRSAGSAAAVAELQATTSSFARRASSSLGDLERERLELGARPVAVREARRVAEVHEVLVRERHEQLVQDGQPADPGVEHPDRAPPDLLWRDHAAQSRTRSGGNAPRRRRLSPPARGSAKVAYHLSPVPTPVIAPLSFFDHRVGDPGRPRTRRSPGRRRRSAPRPAGRGRRTRPSPDR